MHRMDKEQMMTFEDIQKVNKGLKTIPIKGKDYVEVNKRVIAFRKIFPEGSITTSVEAFANDTILVKAEVRDGNGKLLASGLAYEEKNSSTINRTSFTENAETSAVGRALGFLGIGIDTSIASYEEVSHAIEQQMISEENYVYLSELITAEKEQQIIEKHHLNSLRELDNDTAIKYIEYFRKKGNTK